MAEQVVVDGPCTQNRVHNPDFSCSVEGWRAPTLAQLPEPLEGQSLRSRLLGSVTEPYWGRQVWELEGPPAYVRRFSGPDNPEDPPLLVRIWSRGLRQWLGPSHRETTLDRERALVLPEGLAQEIFRLWYYADPVLIEAVDTPRLAVFDGLGRFTGRIRV